MAVAVLLVQFLTQPAYLYEGDADAIRNEASYLVSHGKLGIPFADVGKIDPPELVKSPSREDQFLWANRERQRYFSRWGVTNTVAFSIPLLFLHDATKAEKLLSTLNAYNALLTALTVAGLLAACAQRRLPIRRSVVFMLAWVYASYLLYYARAQSAEIVQCVIAVWSFVAFRSLNSRLDARLPAVVATVAMNGLLAALMFAKIQFAVVWLLALAGTYASRPLRQPLVRITAVISGVLLVAGCAAHLALNAFKFGSVFEIGKLGYPYPHETAGWGFTVHEYAKSLPDFLWGTRGNVMYHAPLIPFALAGAWATTRRAPRESAFILGMACMSVLLAGALVNHNGEWAFGPRYLVQSVVLLAVVGVEVFAMATDATRSIRVRAFAWSSYVVAVLFGFSVEAYVCAFHPFAAQRVEGAFRGAPLPPGADEYFNAVTRAQLLGDLRSLCEGGSGPLAEMAENQARLVGHEKSDPLLKTVVSFCAQNFVIARR